MTEKMSEKSAEGPEGDRASLRSDGKSSTTNGGLMRSFRRSMRRAAGPFSPGGKGSKVTSNGADEEPRSPPPPSPSLSAGSPTTSALKNIFLPKKTGNESNVTPKMKRSNTDPSMPKGGRPFSRMHLWYQSMGGKRGKDKPRRPDLFAAFETPVEGVEQEEQEEQVEQVEQEEQEEVPQTEEAYTLPELPSVPLSVMQISNMMRTDELGEAHLHLLALRREFQQEREEHGDASPLELVKKEKDLHLLYEELRGKVSATARDPGRDRELLVKAARVVQEEERRAGEPGGLPGSWREAWREAVGEGVRARVRGVPLEQREQNASWLAVHLGLLGKEVVGELEGARRELRRLYPPSFDVFGVYVSSCHAAVGQHLRGLEPRVTELKDLYALLNWIINTYQSEEIMGNPSLLLDMNEQSTDLLLERNFLEQLKGRFLTKMKEEMKLLLERVIDLEATEFWKEKKSPEKDDDGLLNSEIHMDIWMLVKGNVTHSEAIEAQLGQRAVSYCLQELSSFPKSFQEKFNELCREKPQPLLTEYHVTYINCFSALQEHMEEYQDSCPQEVESVRRAVEELIRNFISVLEGNFKSDVEAFLRRMITRKWLNDDRDFTQLCQRTRQLGQHCNLMRPLHAQALVKRLHQHVVKYYVGQLMKNNFSCKNQFHERAAEKIRRQHDQLSDAFRDMKSTEEWLYPVGDDLSDIIGQRHKADIKDHVEPLVEHYPDVEKKHLIAVLNFRGLVRGRKHWQILQHFSELKKKCGGTVTLDRSLFGQLQVATNPDCLSNFSYSCLSS